MRIAYCKIKGYKRFESATVNLDRNLLAFVGPNEAGKSSFFEILESIENDTPISQKELTRNYDYLDSHTIIEVAYFIESEDINYLRSINGAGTPKFYTRIKKVNGNKFYKFSEEIFRDPKRKEKVVKDLDKITSLRYFRKRLSETFLVEENDMFKSLYDFSLEVLNTISDSEDTLSPNEIVEINYLSDQLSTLIEELTESKQEIVKSLIVSLKDLVENNQSTHPSELFAKYLQGICPKIKIFDNENRILKESYSLEEIKAPPPSFFNILSVAEINYEKLASDIENSNFGSQETIIEDGNAKLKEKYNKYWNQASVYPRLKLDGNEIRILLRFVDTYNELSDRSDGLKQFISLMAFALSNQNKNELILLIDEAEMHLHYSAQADIVELFEKQKLVNSIFYSTHSAGCLPSDLGTGIRVVKPIIAENGKETAVSEIRNSIWGNTSGFSPILMAMGASIIAFSLARKALIAEGPSETILLPRLFREAAEVEELDFQVAPGLATISAEKCSELDLEASKVAYLVDGDDGGRKIETKLKNAGIKANTIVSLPKGKVLEDFVDKEILLDAVNSLLIDFSRNSLNLSSKAIPEKNSIEYLKVACKEKGESLPSKVLIAERVVSNDKHSRVLRRNQKGSLYKVLEKVLEVLKK